MCPPVCRRCGAKAGRHLGAEFNRGHDASIWAPTPHPGNEFKKTRDLKLHTNATIGKIAQALGWVPVRLAEPPGNSRPEVDDHVELVIAEHDSPTSVQLVDNLPRVGWNKGLRCYLGMLDAVHT